MTHSAAPVRPVPPAVVVESFRADDAQAAQLHMRRVHPKAELRDSKRNLRFQQDTWRHGGVGFTRFRFDSRMQIEGEFDDVAAFGLVLGGEYAARSNGAPIATRRPFLFIPGAAVSQSDRLDLLTVHVALDELGAAASGGAGAARPRFAGTAPVSPALEAHWLHTLRYAWRSVVLSDELFQNPLIRTATFDAVLAAAVAAFPITAEASTADQDQRAAVSRAVRLAQDFIDEHVAEAVTVQQIARAAGVSVRALQLGFRRDLDTTPLQHLRRRRLEAARAALLEASPDHLRVGELGQRWGWSNGGRFTAEYRALFGESPSRTLRR